MNAEPGDLVQCISDETLCGLCDTDVSDQRVRRGAVLTVSHVYPPLFAGAPVGYDFAEAPLDDPDNEDWCSCCFRKINDSNDECELLVELLNRSKRVSA